LAVFDMRQPKILFQARDATDVPADGADCYVVRRGLQVGSGSIASSVNSPDPGAVKTGDICLVLRDGALVAGAVVTLLGDPVYDPDNRVWNVTTSLVGSWTPQVDDRLVLSPGIAAHNVEIYDDPIGNTAATQPVTLGTDGIFEQWSQHSGYDVIVQDAGEIAYQVGGPNELKTFVTPEEFGAVGDGVTVDTAAIQAAMDYAHSVGGLSVRALPKVYRVGDLAIRRGVAVQGSYVYRSSADPRYRGTMFVSPRPGVVNALLYGVSTDSSQETGDRLRGFSFEAITFANAWLEDDWTTLIGDPDNKPIVLLEDVVRAHFKDCEFTHADRHAMKLLGCWDSRFDNLRFMESGNDLVGGVSSGTFYSTVLLDQSTGYGGGCNNLYFNDCVWESNAQLAIEAKAGGHNECYFNNAKVESVVGDGPIASFTDCVNFGFLNFQTTTAFDDASISAVVFNSCRSCYGNLGMEHEQGSGNQIDHYVELNSCGEMDLSVHVYGFDQSVNGLVGDDNEYSNKIRTATTATRVANHPVTTYHDATVHHFPVDDGEVSLLLKRRDKSTFHWLGRLEDDGAGGAIYKHMANSNVAFRVLADGTLLLNRPIQFFGGGTFDPADLKGRFSKEVSVTPVDESTVFVHDLFGMYDPTARVSGANIGQGRLLIGATSASGWQMRITGTIVNDDGTTTPGGTEDVLISVTTPALPNDTNGQPVPNVDNMYLTENVFQGVVTISTVSGVGTLDWLRTVAVDELDDYVTTNRAVNVNQFGARAHCDDIAGGSNLQVNMLAYYYAASTKRITTLTHEDISFTGVNGLKFSEVRKPGVVSTSDELMILAYAYHTGVNSFSSHWHSVGAFCNGEYEVE